MRIRRLPLLVALLASALVLPACGAGGASGGVDDPGTVPGTGEAPSATELAYAQRVFELVNEARADADLPPLLYDDRVAQVAYEHSVDMDRRNYFDHVNPDGDSPGTRARDAGISWSAYGENIAYGQQSPEEVMSDWMGSSGHRANILSATYTHMGVGVHIAPGGPWWTQNFLRP